MGSCGDLHARNRWDKRKRLEARVGVELLMVLKTKEISLESVVLPDEILNIRRGLAQF